MQDKQQLIYLYDLPKQEFTSARLAELLNQNNIQLEHKPQVRRDPTKPFYSAIMCINDKQVFKKACECLRYFDIEDKPCRGLPFDNSLLGTFLQKTNENNNVFVRKIPKEMKAGDLEKMFSEFPEKNRPIKSLKISRDDDHSSRGYGFVCYENEEDASWVSDQMQESETRQDCLAVKWNPKNRTDVRKLFNNLYVKNYPEEWNDDQVRGLFEPYGHVGSLVQIKKEGVGNFAFVCFMAEDKNDHQYGPEHATAAIDALNGREMENGKQLYVKPALSASDRKKELIRETIKYKNSKKRCNLYVKNFDPKMTEENMRHVFSGQDREIESIKMFPLDKEEKAYAFVCFKTPDQAQAALSQLHNQNIQKRQLQICHYELKEFREIQDEETKDKLGFQRYKEQNYKGSSQWNDISSRDEFYYKITQLLATLPPQQRNLPGFQSGGQMRQNNQGGFNKQSNYGGQNRNNSNGRQRQGYQNNSMPAGNNRGPMMPGPTSQMPAPQFQGGMNIPNMNAPNPLESKFYAQTMKLVPSVQRDNPHLKQQVGNAIFDFVTQLKGTTQAPKITGMLIDLPLEEIKGFLQNYTEFMRKVNEASQLLTQIQNQQAQAPMQPPQMQPTPMAPGQAPPQGNF